MLQRSPLERVVRRRSSVALLGALLLVLGGSGCATYSDRMEKAHVAAAAGDYTASERVVNKLVGVKKSDELPDEFKGDRALALLERASIKQATSRYDDSARDFQVADKELEFLDLTNDTIGSIGKYIYSDSSGKYKSSATEKLALNTYNMMNYLAEGKLSGARVEARRFTVMRSYLNSLTPDSAYGAAGSYLAGFVMEQLDEYGSAMRYYDEAMQVRPLESLRDPVNRLAPLTNYRGTKLSALIEPGRSGELPKNFGELLVVVNLGRVPHKEPKRIPIGAAVGLAGAFISGNPDVLGHSVAKVVVYPGLVESPNKVTQASLLVDGQPAPLELVADFAVEIRQEYEELLPRIIGAAISRMIVRAVAAEGVRQGAQGGGASSGVAFLAAILTEFTLVAMDKPDTRSWQFLPEKVHIYRHALPAGTHRVEVQLGPGNQGTVTREVEIRPGAFVAVIITEPR
jgi:tetratricopeptide (TPR) repeat protein